MNAATPIRAIDGEELRNELDRVIQIGDFATHFQPLVDLRTSTVFGYEALTRGPSDSPLHAPIALLEVAARFGRLVELERLLLRLIVQRFSEQGLPGRLFVNVSADTLVAVKGRLDILRRTLQQIALPPERIVVELTETRPILAPDDLHAAIEGLRGLGIVMALDDLGEGFSSLRRWSEMRPEYVKLDRHFVDGLHNDPIKQQFVRSVLSMAAMAGATVIAEGLEEESDLRVLQDLGVPIGQGYLLGKPTPTPRTSVRPDLSGTIGPRTGAMRREQAMREFYGKPTTAGQLASRGQTLSEQTTCAEVVALFSASPHLISVPVLDQQERPIGLLRAMDVLRHGSERYYLDLYGKKPCTALMDAKPMVFDYATTLRTMSEEMSSGHERILLDGFVVTREGYYYGTGRVSDLLRAISDLQVFSARYANPLTLLPGNVPIDTQIEALLEQRVPFVAVHWDLDNFKPFNDLYGYRAGDEIIQLTARILRSACDSEVDFVGHIGGDDFLSLFCSADWEERIQRVLIEFDSQVRGFFTEEDRDAGGFTTLNRQGERVFHPLTSLSAGAVKVSENSYEAPAQLARALSGAKKHAKRMDGSAYFVERRRPEQPINLSENADIRRGLATLCTAI
ncbi:GGDEF domain-containing protein [Niveibacterium microcysteis]|uniref:GGDEF domain-containing protein n=1 Tax=Niveibacterium microcysteis TaxID=2811415 RepID=A0ABX7MD94_9RHOO|nr:GGDEF domain-containing protein [Niveibacterium microcysteis]QSI78610.1 GGDEF domain-containing protein [Niveibacterium microcysteis]